jgi:2-polyprenyl-3-methyl-5-hydroxy-6-metoxy-1,4-benzoquinol methylase
MFYRMSFACNDHEDLQEQLNSLYEYKDDPWGKVMHRNRLNLVFLLVDNLIRMGTIESLGFALDIGCNKGVYGRILSDYGFRDVLGIDIVARDIETANACFAVTAQGRSLRFELQNAETMETRRKNDFILCTEVIEHVQNPEAVIANIEAALAPNGVAVVSLPNVLSLPFLNDILSHKLRQKAMDQHLQDHIRYPFYKSLHLFRGTTLQTIQTTGSGVFFIRFLVRNLVRTPIFPIINHLSFTLGRRWPFKYFAHSFFLVLKKNSNDHS